MSQMIELILRIEEEDFLDHKQLNKVKDIIKEVLDESCQCTSCKRAGRYKGEVKK